MILTITQIGLTVETDALTSGVMPRFTNLVIGDGVPHASPFLATAMVHPVYEVEVLVVERISAGAVKFHAVIPQEIALTIREVGLLLEDGTLYAYTDYAQGSDEIFYKPSNFAFSFYVLLAREQLPELVFTYSPLDTDDIVETIINNVTNEFNFNELIQNYIAGELAVYNRRLSVLEDPLEAEILYSPIDGSVTGVDEVLPRLDRAYTYTYDANGRIASVDIDLDGPLFSDPGIQSSYTETFSYDGEGRVVGMLSTRIPDPSIYVLTVTTLGASGVEITADPDDYSGTTNYFKGLITEGTVITLTAPETAGGASFVSWSGADETLNTACTVTMTGNKTVIANYA
ncbi:MAG: hypothetical protein EOM21_20725 [Gammaproteobacteria bacterium]|nr:hypothetical protein [Gammaproteobacteria bacterium]